MNYDFLNPNLKIEDLLSENSSDINTFLLQNNREQLENLYNFYKGEINLLNVNGFLGVGKSEIVKHSLSVLSQNSIVFWYNCFQSTVLDDILLSFFIEFKKLFSKKIIDEPKFRSENFAQKINNYFLKVEKPFVIVLNSFNDVMLSNRQEIFDFISHLSTLGKVKIIIIAKEFPSDLLTKSNLPCSNISLAPLEFQYFEKYLRSSGIKSGSILLKKLYEVSGGYYFYTALMLKYSESQGYTLEKFYKEFSLSFMSFNDFMAKNASDMVPPTSRNLFWFVSMLRHSVSLEFLKKAGLYDEEVIKILIDRQVFIFDRGEVYVRDYFKENLDVSVAVNIAQKLHQYIINLYENELPLKPLERDVAISRQTMRGEIEYHKLFLPKRPKPLERAVDTNYLTYSNRFEFDLSNLNKKVENQEKKEPPKLDKRFLEMKEKKDRETKLKNIRNPHLNLSSLDTSGINSKIENSEEVSFDGDPFIRTPQKPVKPAPEISLKELMIQATIAQEDYKYRKAVGFYTRALTKAKNDSEKKVVAEIYVKLAHCYQELSDKENALQCYYMAQDLFSDEKDYIMASRIKLNISKLLYETYKFEPAKEYALIIVRDKKSPPLLIVKAFVQLSNIEEGLSNQEQAYEYIELALKNSDETMDSEILSEVYFKYALSQDDKENFSEAIKYYEKCTQISSNPDMNKFLSSAFSNLASLYFEQGNEKDAIVNYEKSFEIDEEKENYDGIYYSASKLATLLRRKDTDKALKYYQSALDASKNLKDVFYEASASLALGDFYYNNKSNELALIQYFDAMRIAKINFSAENQKKIEARINDLRVKMGEEAFSNAIKRFE